MLVTGASVPATLNEWLPAGTLVPTSIVNMLVAVPSGGGVTGFGAKAQVTPEGWPLQLRLTALLKPVVDVTVAVLVPLPPAGIVSVAGLRLTLKSGVGCEAVTAAKNTSCCG